jgi:hypothetical protein
MYTIYPNANAAARNVRIITDHTGSDGLSKGLNSKFIKKVPIRDLTVLLVINFLL